MVKAVDPVSNRTPDPLVSAIETGSLSDQQRAALADLVSLLSEEMATDRVSRPGTLMDRAMEESGSWGTVRAGWERLRRDLYPQKVNK